MFPEQRHHYTHIFENSLTTHTTLKTKKQLSAT